MYKYHLSHSESGIDDSNSNIDEDYQDDIEDFEDLLNSVAGFNIGIVKVTIGWAF